MDDNWVAQVSEIRSLLQQEADLNEIVRLVGFDALGEKDRLTLECARVIREDFLQQDSFREVDRYTPPKKQAQMLYCILLWYHKGEELVQAGGGYDQIMSMRALENIGRMKYTPDEEWEDFFSALKEQLNTEFAAIRDSMEGEAL